MDGRLEISTLGGLRVVRNGVDIKFETQKEYAILVYLAGSGRSHPREVLASMFWEYHDQTSAQRNFARNISNLRRALDDHLDAPTRGSFVALDRTTDIWYDLEEVEAQLLSYTDADLFTASMIPDLENTLAQCPGDFLEGFYVESTEFEQWAQIERARIRRRIANALHSLALYYARSGDYDEALDVSARLLAMDELNEEAHRLTIALLALSGQRAAAIRHYQDLVILLQAQGLKPDDETQVLIEQVRAGEKPQIFGEVEIGSPSIPQLEVHETIHHNLPILVTPFIGRRRELEELGTLIAQPSTRLITIFGSGGVGKTRLALKIGENSLEHFGDGVFYVPLANVDTYQRIVPAIGNALHLEFAAGDDMLEYLLTYLQDKHMLLILDNFEHLLDGADLVADILYDAPQVSAVVTSREILHLRGEILFPLEGLHYPRHSDDDPLETDSGKLFVASAQRVDPSYVPTNDMLPPIADICRLVRGTPLAIELAAGWVSMLHPAQILEEILQSIDVLETRARDVPERHRSMRAVFDSSWEQLDDIERDALQRLSVFHGGFDRPAAQSIANAGLRVLNMLMSKSILYRSQTGRFEIHELLLQYVREIVTGNPVLLDQLQNAHCTYFASLIAEQQSKLRAGYQEETLLDLENLHAAWHYVVHNHRLDAVEQLIDGLWMLFEIQGWYDEGRLTFELAVTRLNPDQSRQSQIAHARCLALFGWFEGQGGQRRRGYELVKEALGMLQEVNAKREYAITCNLLPRLASSQSEIQEARDFLIEGEELLTTDEFDNSRIASLLIGRAELERMLGNDEAAKHFASEAEKLEQEINSPRGKANAARVKGDAQRAMGEYDEAWQTLMDSLAHYRQLNYRQGEVWALNGLGKTALMLGNIDEAMSLLGEAFQIAAEIKTLPMALDILVDVAEAFQQMGKLDLAVTLFTFVSDNKRAHGGTQNQVTDMLGLLESQMDAEAFRDARRLGAQLTINRILDEILRPSES